ncbi:MAG: zinc-dependent alcohol dehydrogenase family protein [Magnetospirillum sp.]|nr:zinc-dependent alcohol dehydrogenase family protein [Magnetospirillum sp.]
MRAMVLDAPGRPLRLADLPSPTPGPGQVLLEVLACGVCRTDLHVVDGELPNPALPLIPGHEVVGRVTGLGEGATRFRIGARVGVPWLGWTCGICAACRSGRENLCQEAGFTGYTLNGGYAEAMVADQRYCFPISEGADDVATAPLLCAGLIGYRALRLAGEGTRLGFWGFGAAAHIIAQVAAWQGRQVHAFTRPADEAARRMALDLGCVWAGASGDAPPEELDAGIIFAPVGALVPEALSRIAKGGTVVCAGIHMSDIPGFPYRLLWGERMVRSVANLTRRDGEEFLALAPQVPVRTVTTVYDLEQANRALADLREGRLTGAAVLLP